ncbi:MAG TPA: cytochrome P450 [Aeromicrobium sp.]|nr:cytochrome P450 [Aeromicrobium sp.]HKY56545.1 cytochrome P450 [Aeromicrobium sp.]
MDRYSPFETHLGDLDTFADGQPHDLFARMRDEAPVMWTDAPEDWPAVDQPGFWSVTRAEHVVAVSHDTETYSSWRGGFTMRTNEVLPLDLQRDVMIGKDGAEHRRMRGTVNTAFTVRRVRELEEQVRDEIIGIIDSVVAAGGCDLAQDVAGPIANSTVCDMLGIPKEDREQINRWTDAFLNADDEIAGGIRGDEALAASAEYLTGLMVAREARPEDDLITALGLATYDGQPMPREEQVGVFSQLFAAGIDSTKNTIGNGVLTLLEHPDQLSLLRAEPGLIPSAVEEILRWTPPFTHQRRTATRDHVLGGQEISAGDSVVMWLPASSRDPRVIDRPDSFDISRGERKCPHHAFGAGGQHFCLGAGLARLELRLFFEEFLARTDDFALSGTPVRIRSCFVDGFKRIPMTVAARRPSLLAPLS